MNNLDAVQYDVIQKASDALDKSISRKDYSSANRKQGYLDGLVECKTGRKSNISRLLQFANWNLEGSIVDGQWGKVAYWESFDFIMMIAGIKEGKEESVVIFNLVFFFVGSVMFGVD